MLLTPQTIPGVFSGTNYNANLTEIEASFLDLGTFVVSGLVPSAGVGLSVSVTAGTAFIGGQLVVGSSFTIAGLANGTTNYLFLSNAGAGSSNTTGVLPANSAFLGIAVTAGGVVTSVTPAPQGRTHAIATKTAAYQMSVFDYGILANATGGSFTVGLPSAVGIAGQEFVVKKIDTSANVVTVAAAGGQLVDNAASVALSAPYTALTFISDSSNFWLI